MTFSRINGVYTNGVSKELHSKNGFDRVAIENMKPESLNSGFITTNQRDSEGESAGKGSFNKPSLSESPNFYKKNGNQMSQIPFLFITPVPMYFKENDWFKKENTWKYITWAFSKCQNQTHKETVHGRELTLAPYEFVSGRLSSPIECFLTENEFRNQQDNLQKQGFLKKTSNSLTNHYSCYVWVTERFNKINNQPKNQQAKKREPTDHHKEEDKIDRLIDLQKLDFDPKTMIGFDHKRLGFIKIVVSDLYEEFNSEGWEVKEIEKAIKKMKDQNPELTGKIQKYLLMILQNDRIQKENQWKNKKNPLPVPTKEPSSKKSPKDKGYYSEEDLSEAPLAKFARQHGLKKE